MSPPSPHRPPNPRGPIGEEAAPMLHDYRRVPSGSESGDDHWPSSPFQNSSEFSFNEKLYDSPTVQAKLRAFFRSRARRLYDITRFLASKGLGPVLPSFLLPHAESPAGHATGLATLDGVRGFACFFVFNFHFLFTYTPTSYRGYGVDPTGETNLWLHQLPFVRLLYAGRAMVTVFFVLSGYVLSRKPLMAIRSKQYDSMLQGLSSSVFRRGLRLFIPTVISTFMVFIALRMDLFKKATRIAYDGVTLSFVEHHPIWFPTLWEQWWHYVNFVRNYIDFTRWEEWYNLYDPHVWTIPLEFRASMVLFLTLVCLARAKTFWRLSLIAALIVFCNRWNRFEIVLFLSGTLIAEVDLITRAWEAPAGTPPPALPSNSAEAESVTWFERWSRERVYMNMVIFVAGLYALSFPDEFGAYTPGFMYLATWIPENFRNSLVYYRFWHSIGAILAMYAINNTPVLRRPFQTPFAQYLGKISYAFYLVHGPILHSLGYIVMRWLWGMAGRYIEEEVIPPPDRPDETIKVTDSGEVGPHMFAFCLFLGWAIVLPISIWAADLFWRFIDVPCVKFARWVENKVTGRG
ncbi:acyltransferase [Phyllosticta capitalensis]